MIGADGLASVVRHYVSAPPFAPRYAGYAAWRGLVPEGDVPPAAAAVLYDRFAFYDMPRSHALGYLVAGADGSAEPGRRRYNWVWYRPYSDEELGAVLTDATNRRHAFSLPPGALAEAAVLQLRRDADALLPSPFADAIRARQAQALRRPFLILSDERGEPAELIPELGRAMRGWFDGEDVAVICNFLPSYGPQLHYYAQHALLPCVFTAEEWKETIDDPENAPLGGVIWLGDPQAQAILASLPPGPQERVTIRNIPFCFWRPETDADLSSSVK